MEPSQTKRNDQIGNSSVNSQRSILKRANSESDGQHSSKEPANKKPRHNMSMASSSILQPSIQKVKSFADLPPEMLDTILNNVTMGDLLNCRQVNRQWNAISSRIMRGRDDICLHFQFIDVGKFIQRIPHRHHGELLVNVCNAMSELQGKSLTDLVVCLQESQHFPFTSFGFDGMNNLGSREMRNFLKIWGKKVRSLKIVLPGSKKTGQILRELLFEKVPNLKKLEIAFSKRVIFSTKSSSNRLSTGLNQLQLPKLEVLCVNSSYREYSKIIEDVLTASTNLKTISMKDDITEEDLEILQTTKKLHCLKDVEIIITEDLIAYWKKSPKCMDLQLQSLSVSFDYVDIADYLSTTKMMNQLFHSSKDVIQSLATEPLGPLTGLVLPKFEKLKKIRLEHYSTEDTMFPLLFDWPAKFPNMKDLDIECTGDGLNLLFDQSLKSLPSIETLRTFCGNRNVLRQIMKMTPNVKTLFIIEGLEDFWPDIAINFEDIATNLPKLENLCWEIYNFHSTCRLDAAITGLPEKLCKKLSAKFRDIDHLSTDKVLNYGANRRHSSMLDLKELRRFEILINEDDFSSEDSDSDDESECENKDKAGFGPESMFYKTGFSKVSKFLGFDLVPNLKVVTRISCDG